MIIISIPLCNLPWYSKLSLVKAKMDFAAMSTLCVSSNAGTCMSTPGGQGRGICPNVFPPPPTHLHASTWRPTLVVLKGRPGFVSTMCGLRMNLFVDLDPQHFNDARTVYRWQTCCDADSELFHISFRLRVSVCLPVTGNTMSMFWYTLSVYLSTFNLSRIPAKDDQS